MSAPLHDQLEPPPEAEDLTRLDADTRHQLAACTPLNWDTLPRHGEEL
jgi:hypothetical protein